MNCKHCGREIHIMHPLGMKDGQMVWSWSPIEAGLYDVGMEGKETGKE